MVGEIALNMHDFVQDLGLWIAFKEGRTIMVSLSNDLNSLIGDGFINDQFAVSSWYRQTNQTSTLFVAAKLEILWIETGGSLDLSSASFEDLQGLKVMVLKFNGNYDPTSCDLSLPPSVESLTNLRTLCLRGWNLGDISFVVKLKKLQLEELIIKHSEELKHIITEHEDGGDTNTGKEIVPASHNSHLILPNLKRLHVSFCCKLESMCPISRIEGLEKLEEIALEKDSQLKYVFGQYDQRDHSSHQKNSQIHFPMLKAVKLHGICPKKYHTRCPFEEISSA
ncbi:hypothetical protein L6164_001160 [Bauhinia variegata]|uniref:Uncharacterized protein n=1 Tax=Bauhinia variegata TaxID=167791 RepID=A0ACB9Q816_BAUVA|nr:hypothetical protein L6164_001160 [Bauhinia variegata]